MLKQYVETGHGSVLRHVSKFDEKGFQIRVHHFEMRKDDLNENPFRSYIYIKGQEFLIRCKRQVETCHICHKPRCKGVDYDKKFDKQWPKFGNGISKRKIRTYSMPKFLRRKACKKKT